MFKFAAMSDIDPDRNKAIGAQKARSGLPASHGGFKPSEQTARRFTWKYSCQTDIGRYPHDLDYSGF
jgi:hypothetical protein